MLSCADVVTARAFPLLLCSRIVVVGRGGGGGVGVASLKVEATGTKNASGEKRLKRGGENIKPEFGSKRGGIRAAAGVGEWMISEVMRAAAEMKCSKRHRSSKKTLATCSSTSAAASIAA